MSETKRPICVTVIGWVWIIISGMMIFPAIMALLTLFVMGDMAQPDHQICEDIPAIAKFFPLLIIGQGGLSTLTFISGVYFLKLRAWARSVLEVLTWTLLIFVIGNGIIWVASWYSSTSGASLGFTILGIIMGITVSAIVGTLLGILLKFLRSQEVRDAMITTTKSLD